jgi:hypothetical protein
LTKEEFITQLERGVAMTAPLPITSVLLRWTADQLKRGNPPWWQGIAKAWEKRQFVAWSEAWSLYINALHFEALNDPKSPFVPFFPSCGGTAEADPSPALARFLSAPTKSFLENLRDRDRRSLVLTRSVQWQWPATLFFQTRGLPYYLVEMNAGGGLDLASDIITKGHKNFDSDLIAARIGLDAQPLDLSDIVHRRWLTAGIWPEHREGFGLLDQAINVVQKRLRDDASFIQLATCPPGKAAAFVAKNIPADDPDVGLLFFNMGATVRMTDPQYESYKQSVATMLKAWGDRGLWVEVETVRGEVYSTTLQVWAHRIVDGVLRSFLMASFDMESAKQVYSEASAQFLAVK